jgi:hypothetical protein
MQPGASGHPKLMRGRLTPEAHARQAAGRSAGLLCGAPGISDPPARNRRAPGWELRRSLIPGLPVVMEQERTLSRLAEARRGSGSNRPGRGSGRNGGPACGEQQGGLVARRRPCFPRGACLAHGSAIGRKRQPDQECRNGDEAGAAPAPSWSRSTVLRMIVLRGILGVATQAASHLLIAEINGESARRHLAAYLLNAVALFVLDRTLSSGDIDATQLADAARQLVRGITGAAQKR